MNNYVQTFGSRSSSGSDNNVTPKNQSTTPFADSKREALSRSKPEDSSRFQQLQLDDPQGSYPSMTLVPDSTTNLKTGTPVNVRLGAQANKFSAFKNEKTDEPAKLFNFHEIHELHEHLEGSPSHHRLPSHAKNLTERDDRRENPLTRKVEVHDDQIVEVCLVEKDGSLTKLPSGSPKTKKYSVDLGYGRMEDSHHSHSPKKHSIDIGLGYAKMEDSHHDSPSSLEKSGSKFSKLSTLNEEECKNPDGMNMQIPRLRAQSRDMRIKLRQNSIEEVTLEQPSIGYGVNDPSRSPERRALNFNLSSLVTPVVNTPDPASPIHNNDEGEAQPVQQQLIPQHLPTEEPIVNPVLPEIEAKLYLKRTIGFFAFMSVASIVAYAMYNDKLPYHLLYLVSHCYLAYYIYENIKRIRMPERESWRIRDDYFYATDGFMGMIFLLFIHLKQLDMISKTIYACVPFMLAAIAYCVLSRAVCGTKNTRAVVRVIAAAQILLVTAKMDGQFDWDWKYIFAPGWAYLGVASIYLVAYGSFLVLLTLFIIFQQHQDETISLPVQIMGFLWYFLYYGIAALMALGIMGVSDAYGEPKDFQIIKIATLANLGLNIFLLIYTLVIFKPLIRYIQVFSLTEGLLMNNEPSQIQIDGQRKIEITLKPEKKQSYFVMLSPTYFLPLNNGIFSRNQENIKRIKRMLERFQFKRLNAFKKSNYEDAKALRPVDIDQLKEYKESLDKKFVKFVPKSPKIEEEDIEAQGTGTRFRDRNKTLRLPPIKVANFKNRATFIDLESLDLNAKRHCSAADLDDMSPMKNPKRWGDDEKSCYICFDHVPDAVLMNCGHGGICFECATELVKKKNECMGCRGPVEAIIKIDPNPKFRDIIKGFEFNKVTQVEQHV